MNNKLNHQEIQPDPPPDEGHYAREFGLYLTGVPVLIVGFLLVWAKALERGGVWWILFFISLFCGCVIGERLRRRTVTLIKKSKESRD